MTEPKNQYWMGIKKKKERTNGSFTRRGEERESR